MEEKEKSTDVNNTWNWPGEYTHNNTGLGIGKIRSEEDLIRLLEGPKLAMAGRLAQTVNNLPADVWMDEGKKSDHQLKQNMDWPGEYTHNNIGLGRG